MSFFTLIFRNLRYYRKPYLAILAGTVISTAVLTGALVVGDSVRYSLGWLTDIRLGKTRFAAQAGDRFFRQQLADELSANVKCLVAPLLQLEGIAVYDEQNSRINRVDVTGIDNRFLKFWNTSITPPGEDEAVLSRKTAEKLKLKPGDEFLLKLPKKSKASENAPFVAEKDPRVSFRLRVSAIADDNEMGRFSLKSNQSAPYNIFISLPSMARKVGLEGNANLLLVSEKSPNSLTPQILDSLLRNSWQPEDVGLKIHPLNEKGSFEIRSGRIFIEETTASAIVKAIPEAKPVLTYLVNSISKGDNSTPYSFVTATELENIKLAEKEILINSWLASDLSVRPGDSVQLKFFRMGALRKLIEDSSCFCIKDVLPIEDNIFDPTLMPDFPGMSDAGNCRDWETGVPINLDKIRDKDEQYWNDHRGTPKAFISFETGQSLWNNAFGQATAYRFTSDSSALFQTKIRLMNHLSPAENGLSFRDVYREGKSAAANSTDFGGLFLSLSFFIIFAALLLIVLLFSLHAQKRMSETAVMATIGIHKNLILRILFLEVVVVVISGSIIGLVCGVFYNKLMLLGLNTIWQDAVRTSVLQMHLEPITLLTGFVIGSITALLAVLIVLIRNLRNPISLTVKGFEVPAADYYRKGRYISLTIAFLSVLSALVFVGFSFFGSQTGSSAHFLLAGAMILVSGIALIYALLQNYGFKTLSTQTGIFPYVIRNISMKKNRTITAIALLSIGTFAVIITGANRKTFLGAENSNQSGAGGFVYWSETTVSLLNDLNTTEGKKKYGLSDEKDLENAEFFQMLSLDGNDASCLNLNQVTQPKILGVSAMKLDQKQSFSFENLNPSINKKHPWLALDKPFAPDIIPAFADQSVITWGMQKKIGDTLLYTDERGKILKVILIGGLNNSVFQGNILISDKLFMHYYPSAGGSKVMLIDGEIINRDSFSEKMEYLFQDYGMVITPAFEKLAEFNAVENTYLTIFMMLGGLGVIIGTIGLGLILQRNVAERKHEIAIYRAVGINNNYTMKLLLFENLFILFSGVAIGLLSAMFGILPSLFSSFQLPLLFLVLIMLLILTNGFIWIYFPLKKVLKTNLIQALRKE